MIKFINKFKWLKTLIVIITVIPWSVVLVLLLQIKSIVSEQPKVKTIPVIEIADTIINEQPKFLSQTPKDGLEEALKYYGVKHPKIVQAQAILETGNFTSDKCTINNNLFGLYDSKKQRYYSFNHWSESVVAYINYIQYRYEPPDNYYKFLQDIGYAEDPEYINKIKEIVKQYDKRRSK